MKLLLSVFLFLFSFGVKGQLINKAYIDNWISKCDIARKTDLRDIYILKGYPYSIPDSSKLNIELSKLKQSELLNIDPFSNRELLPFSDGPESLITLIVSRGGQARKSKRAILKTVLTKYKRNHFYQNHIDVSFKEPVLSINGKLIFHADCYNALSKIKLNAIKDIYYNHHQVPWEYYGENSKNGLVTIWTK